MRRIVRQAAAAGSLAVLLGLGPAAARAQEVEEESQDLQEVVRLGVLRMNIGAGRLVTTPVEVDRVALADEAIARVQIISAREVLLTGLRTGRTTLFLWLTDGERERYELEVDRDLGFLRRVLTRLDRGIEVEASADGSGVLLTGEVADRATAEQAVTVAESALRAQGPAAGATQVVSLLRYPTSTAAPDLWLTDALRAIDPRIRLRRIQVGPEPVPERDSYILEGRVRNIQALTRAVILAERQLGNPGVRVEAPAAALSWQRNRVFQGAEDRLAQTSGLSGLARPVGGLASQVARGLAVTSESGRVLSLLAVDELPQVSVAIRVLEVDRAKARKAGVNFRIDSEHLSIGSFTGPQGTGPRQLGGAPDVSAIPGGNLVGSFVDRTLSILAAIDLLESKDLARSVSEPNILTLSGEEATVLVGGEVPIPITATGQVTTVQGFEFQDFGVRLDIRPTVDEEGIVALEVSPSIIRPSPGLSVAGVPGFQVQSVQTTARVPAGQSLVLGGLLSFEEALEESRVPWLGKLPLFRWERRSRQQQELLFVITPRRVALPEAPPEPPAVPAEGGKLELPPLDWPQCRLEPDERNAPPSLFPDRLPLVLRCEPPPGPPPPPPDVAPPDSAPPEVPEPDPPPPPGGGS